MNTNYKYNSLSDFRKANLSEYNWLASKNLLEQLCNDMGWELPKINKPKGYWTLELCKEEALKYTSRSEWFKKHQKSYDAANRKKWHDECAKHMIRKNKPNGYWTKERCKTEAYKYNTIKEWAVKNGSSYSIAKTNGWLKEISTHMIRKYKPNGYWVLETYKAEALKYMSKREWELKNKSTYSMARKSGFFNKIIDHMVEVKKPNGYWTKEKCLEEALKYNTKESWRKASGSSYGASRKNGWMVECTKHMTK